MLNNQREEFLNICNCKTEIKGRWIVDPEKGQRAYVCQRCKKRVYAKKEAK